ncbi:acetylornithine transaminase [Lacticaseibacillus daqingensis]|uniref:acetylornithine transaminase n=1 Tax=Lacticaseibacillus daqingensis TaxID=2486014 RepID=UPI000F776014|nr:acetylornithine transaminase [Lacticaseibacillus daqingensis]
MTHLFPTYDRFPIDLVSGTGVHLTDATGQTYLDMTSGIGVCSFGYAHPAITAAVSDQMTRLWHTSNLYASALQEHTADLLATPAQRVFFCNSGTEANEAALKLARKATGRTQVLAFNNGFHGRTFGAMSMTGNPSIREGFGPLVPDIQFADYNDPAAVTAITPALAAVILEVIQGEGGVYPADTTWLTAIAAACHQNGVLLIVDEVQTGIGRTGTRFGYQQYGLTPDIVTCAKALGNGLPIGAMIGSAALAPAFGPGVHGSTFGGNLLALAAASAVLTALTPDFLAQVQHKAIGVWQQLTTEIAPLPAVTGVSGRGLMIGIHLAPDRPVTTVIRQLQAAGVLTLAAKHNTLRLLPPLISTPAELNLGLTTIANVLKEEPHESL